MATLTRPYYTLLAICASYLMIIYTILMRLAFFLFSFFSFLVQRQKIRTEWCSILDYLNYLPLFDGMGGHHQFLILDTDKV